MSTEIIPQVAHSPADVIKEAGDKRAHLRAKLPNISTPLETEEGPNENAEGVKKLKEAFQNIVENRRPGFEWGPTIEKDVIDRNQVAWHNYEIQFKVAYKREGGQAKNEFEWHMIRVSTQANSPIAYAEYYKDQGGKFTKVGSYGDKGASTIKFDLSNQTSIEKTATLLAQWV